MPNAKWYGMAKLIVQDKNSNVLTRTIEIFPALDTIKFIDEAAQKAATLSLLGTSVLDHCNNGLSADVSYMGVAAVVVAPFQLDADLVAWISGLETDYADPTAVLPDEFVVRYPMMRRVKYRAINASGTLNIATYFKTPENLLRGDPVDDVEYGAFNVYSDFLALNVGDIGLSKLYFDWRFIFQVADVVLSDHIQAKSGRRRYNP